MDLEKLRTFQRVVSEGGIVKSAEVLKMDKSSISRQLSLLEKQVGRKLFEKHGKKMILTDEGKYLLERANHILMEVEATMANLKENLNLIRRDFTISTTFAVASLWLTRFLHLFIEQNQELTINVKASSLPLNLSLREADVAIRPYANNQPELVQTHLKTWRLHLYAHKSYIKKFGTPKTVQELDLHRILILGNDPNVYPFNYACWPLINHTRQGKYRKPFLLINSVEGMYNLVMNGVGIGNFGDNFPFLDTMVPILKEKMWFDIDAYLSYPIAFSHLEIIRKFEDFLLKIIKENKIY